MIFHDRVCSSRLEGDLFVDGFRFFDGPQNFPIIMFFSSSGLVFGPVKILKAAEGGASTPSLVCDQVSLWRPSVCHLAQFPLLYELAVLPENHLLNADASLCSKATQRANMS